ncbi:MAG: hypothetical protein IJK54_07135 [Clostridia bacterium]|nr:hypothetical protein [Clostridia bacterium]
MQKKKKIIVWIAVAAVVLTLAVLCIPTRYQYKDGGTVVYEAILFKVYRSHSIEAHTTDGHVAFLVGTIVEILGKKVYDGTYLEAGSEPLPTFRPGETAALYVRDPSGTVHTYHYKGQGMNKIDLDHTLWFRAEKNGCILDYNDGHQGYDIWVTLKVGEVYAARIGDEPDLTEYRLYFAADGAPLPAGW